MITINRYEGVFGMHARSRKAEAAHHGLEGALAALESFYYGFNNRDIATMHFVWDNSDAILLNNPVGGMARGKEAVMEIYDRIFYGRARVWVELSDIGFYAADELVVFTGSESGAFTSDGVTIPLKIRTSRIFGFQPHHHHWVQLHHHGSIDNADVLQRYQDAVL